MRQPLWVFETVRLVQIALVLLYCSSPLAFADAVVSPGIKTQAYVTLLYGEDFLLGVRVLGESLRKTGTTRDMVVLAAGQISEYATQTLVNDGWHVHPVDAVDNPGMRGDGGYPNRFYAVYSKLYVFGLQKYEKVVFLDADTVVVQNSDELFNCPGFCATLRHSERFNSGVMVITPSNRLFRTMMDSIHVMHSYTGGDQGFLNEFFKDFASGPVFDPAITYEPRQHEYMMLPTRYNADIGLYVFNSNRWSVEGSLKIVHYTLASFKPWSWWCGWLVEEQARWNKHRMRLGPDVYGRRHGITLMQSLAQSWMPLLPPLVGILVGRGLAMGWPAYILPVVRWVPPLLPRNPSPVMGLAAGYGCLAVSVCLAVALIPSYVTPSWGWILAYEYTFLLFFLLYGKCLHFFSVAGRVNGHGLSLNRSVPHQLPWFRTMIYLSTLATLLLIAPFLNTLLGVPGFIPKILLTIAGALITNTFATHAFVVLCQDWFFQTPQGQRSASG